MKLFKLFDLNIFKFLTCLIFFSTPFESIGISEDSASFSVTKLAILAQFAVWFINVRKIDNNPILRSFTLLGVFWLSSCLWAIDVSVASDNFFRFYLPTLFLMITISSSIDSWKDIRNILVSYFLGCIIIAIYCHTARKEIIANAIFADMERVSAFGQDENELAFLLVMGIVIALHGIQAYSNKIIKLFLLGCSLLFLYAILLTGSRTGSIMVITVLVLFIINNKKYFTYTLPVLVLLIPYIISQIPEGTIERLLQTEDQIKSGDFTNRGEIWGGGISAFMKENVFFGVGYQNFPSLMMKYYNQDLASHSTYISYFVTGGIIGSCLFISIIVKMFNYCKFFIKRTRNLYWLAYVLPLFLAMITLETQYRRWIFMISIVLYKSYEILNSQKESYDSEI